MPKYFKNNKIDYLKWDACIQASKQNIIYGLSWYLDVVAPNWSAFIEEDETQYLAVMPLPETRKFGIHFLYQPFFCQQLGIFTREKGIDYNNFISKLFDRYKYIQKYNFNTDNTSAIEIKEANKLKIVEYQNHHLSLHCSYEQLSAHYSRDRKVNLKRAKKGGLKIVPGECIKPLITLFKEDAAARIMGGVSEETYLILERLFEVTNLNGFAKLLYTQSEDGELDSGGLFLIYNKKIIYLFSAASKKGRNKNGRTLIIDYLLQQYALSQYIFDFESPPSNYNITRVYQSFGSIPTPYYNLTYNNLPIPFKMANKIRHCLIRSILNN